LYYNFSISKSKGLRIIYSMVCDYNTKVVPLCKEFQPPLAPKYDDYSASVFLAGTIEMGKATEWQRKMVASFGDLPVAILNPRRDDWDPTWKQRASNPEFHEQVTWELDGLDKVGVIALFFEPGTVSPISLLELGKLAERRPKEVVICCPVGFWRVGNVEMMAERHGMCLVREFDEMVAEVRRRLEDLCGASSGACAAP
jgi:hypothetical protein